MAGRGVDILLGGRVADETVELARKQEEEDGGVASEFADTFMSFRRGGKTPEALLAVVGVGDDRAFTSHDGPIPLVLTVDLPLQPMPAPTHEADLRHVVYPVEGEERGIPNGLCEHEWTVTTQAANLIIEPDGRQLEKRIHTMGDDRWLIRRWVGTLMGFK